MELRYFRDTDGREVDFVVLEDRRPIRFIECKLNEEPASKGLRYLKQRFPEVEARQISKAPTSARVTAEGIHLASATDLLGKLC